MRPDLLTSIGLAGVLLAGGFAPQSPRPKPMGTGLVVGQVVDGSTGRGIPEAIVQLVYLGGGVLQTRVLSDGEGRFFFSDLPAGELRITASKPGYGSRVWLNAPLVPFDLADAERRGDAKITLWKHGVIAGTVIDDRGEPVVGVTVRAFRRLFLGGRQRLLALNLGRPVTTDDRGAYRIGTLDAGDYVVVVPSVQTTVPVAMLTGAARGTISAINEVSSLGTSRNQQIGDFVLMTHSSVSIPPGPDSAGRLEVFQTTYHPNAVTAADSTAITVRSGEERSGIDIQLKSVPSMRVSGRLVAPQGSLPAVALRLVPASSDRLLAPELDTVTGMAEAGGAFTLLGVPPGRYILRVSLGRPGGNLLPQVTTPEKPVLWASQPVSVGEADVSGLDIVLRPAVRLTGRFEFSGAKPPPDRGELSLSQLNLRAVTGAAASDGGVFFDARGAFVAYAAGGRYAVQVEAPSGWYVDAILVNGRDVLDAGIDLEGDADIVVRLTDQTTDLSGTVSGGQGVPDPTAVVLVYPVDWEARINHVSAVRRFANVPVRQNGAFSVTDLPPGAYFVAAVSDEFPANWQEPSMLESLSRSAARVQLSKAERKFVDLRTIR